MNPVRHMGINELASDWQSIQMTNEAEERIMERLRAERVGTSKGHPVVLAMRRARWVSTFITAAILVLISVGIGGYLSLHSSNSAANPAQVRVYGYFPMYGADRNLKIDITEPQGPVSILDVSVTVHGAVGAAVKPIFLIVQGADTHIQKMYAVTNEKVVLKEPSSTYRFQIPVPAQDGEYYIQAKSDTFPSPTNLANTHWNDCVIYVEHQSSSGR